MEIIPTQEANIGDEITYNGLRLKVDIQYSQGKDAKNSSYKYFMHSPKGVWGLKEV